MSSKRVLDWNEISKENQEKILRIIPLIAGSKLFDCGSPSKDSVVGFPSGVFRDDGEGNPTLAEQVIWDANTITRGESTELYFQGSISIGRALRSSVNYTLGSWENRGGSGGSEETEEEAEEEAREEAGEEDIELEGTKGEHIEVGMDSDRDVSESSESEEKTTTKDGAEEDEGKDSDEVECVKDDLDLTMYLGYIKNKISDLCKSYKELYEPCYNFPSKGVLTPQGIYSISGHELKLKSTDPDSLAELQLVYKLIQDAVGTFDGTTNFNSSVSPKELIQSKGIPLLIKYHLSNMFGYFGNRSKKATTYRELESYISDRTDKIMYNILKKLTPEEKADAHFVETLILQYMASIKTCILVDDYIPGAVLKLRICLDSNMYPEQASKLTPELFQPMIDSGYLFTVGTSIEVVGYSYDVLKINFVIDKNTYYNAPLFAYEALEIIKEQNIELSFKNLLLGKDLQDNLVFGKFGSEQRYFYNILAGSGSGKGVMTLAILASALAANMPACYWDCKPDMAQLLWDTAEGQNVVAFDGDATNGLHFEGKNDSEKGQFCVNWSSGVPEYVRAKLGVAGCRLLVKTYCYLRGIQLCCMVAKKRQFMMEAGQISSDDFFLFVFDEIGRVTGQVQKLLQTLKSISDDRRAELKGQKGVNADLDEAVVYCKNFAIFVNDIIDLLESASSAELRKAQMKVLVIWQPTWLKSSLINISSKGNEAYIVSKLYKMLTEKGTVRFGGKGADTPNAGALGTSKITDKLSQEVIGQYRYFAYTNGGELTDGDSELKIIRPFLLLNDASPGSAARCVATNELARDKVYRNGVEGDIIPEIGFANYVNKLLGGDIKGPLCRSWGIVKEVLIERGFSGDLMEFMYSPTDFRKEPQKEDGYNTNGSIGELDSFSQQLKDAEDQVNTEDFSKEEQGIDFNQMVTTPETVQAEKSEDFSDSLAALEAEAARMNLIFDAGVEEEIDPDEEFDWDEEGIQLNEATIQNTNPINIDTPIEDIPMPEADKEQYKQDMSSIENSFQGFGDWLKNFKQRVANDPSAEDADIVQDNIATNGVSPKSELTIEYKDGVMMYNDPEATFETLMKAVTTDVFRVFGGPSRITSFAVVGGGIAVNNTMYRCGISSKSAAKMPFDVRQQLNSGQIATLFDYRMLKKMPNLNKVVIDSEQFYIDYLYDLFPKPASIRRSLPKCRSFQFKHGGGYYDILSPDFDSAYHESNFANYTMGQQMAASIQSACFRGTKKSMGFIGNTWKSDKKLWQKILGTGAGVGGMAVTGAAGTGTAVARGLAKAGKGFLAGAKNLFKE